MPVERFESPDYRPEEWSKWHYALKAPRRGTHNWAKWFKEFLESPIDTKDVYDARNWPEWMEESNVYNVKLFISMYEEFYHEKVRPFGCKEYLQLLGCA